MVISTEVRAEEALRALKEANIDAIEGASNGIEDAGWFMVEEVKSSIAGQRDEPCSVDTGRFLNSVSFLKEAELEGKVFSNVEYAIYIEEGHTLPNGTWWEGRHHFRNSLARNKQKIRQMIIDSIIKAIK